MRTLGLASGPSTKPQPRIVLTNVATPKPMLYQRLDSGKKPAKIMKVDSRKKLTPIELICREEP